MFSTFVFATLLFGFELVYKAECQVETPMVNVTNITCFDGEPIRFVVSAHPLVNMVSPGIPYVIESTALESYDGANCPLNEGGVERDPLGGADPGSDDDYAGDTMMNGQSVSAVGAYNFSVPRDTCTTISGPNNTVIVYVPVINQIQSSEDILLSILCVTPDNVLNISVDTVANVESVPIDSVSVVDDTTPVVSVAVHRSDTNEQIAPGESVEVGISIYLTINLTSNPFDGYIQLMISSIEVKNSQTTPDEALTLNIFEDGCNVDGNPLFGSTDVLTEDQATSTGLERQTHSFAAFRYTDQSDEVVFVIQSRICVPTEIDQCQPSCVRRKKRQVDESTNLVSYFTLTVRKATSTEQSNETPRALSGECEGFGCDISTPVIVGTTLGLVVFMAASISALAIFAIKKKSFIGKEVVI